MIAGRNIATTQFRIPTELKKLLKHAAVDNGRSLNAEVIQRLKASLKAEGKQVQA